MLFLHVITVTYLTEYRLRLTFNDGVVKEVDLEPELSGEIFVPLHDLDYFRQVTVDPDTDTIAWPNGADFAPEFLYEIGVRVRSKAA